MFEPKEQCRVWESVERKVIKRAFRGEGWFQRVKGGEGIVILESAVLL